jgi:hypothetical protein
LKWRAYLYSILIDVREKAKVKEKTTSMLFWEKAKARMRDK